MGDLLLAITIGLCFTAIAPFLGPALVVLYQNLTKPKEEKPVVLYATDRRQVWIAVCWGLLSAVCLGGALWVATVSWNRERPVEPPRPLTGHVNHNCGDWGH